MQAMLVVAVSGRVCAGKTTLASDLAARYDWTTLSTRHVVAQHAHGAGRAELQSVGHALDIRTAGLWVAEAVQALRDARGDLGAVVVDAVRVPEQVVGLRASYEVVHAHLVAPIDVLTARYEEKRRSAPGEELASYALVAKDPTEAAADSLAVIADVILDTHRNDVDALAREVDRLTRRSRRG